VSMQSNYLTLSAKRKYHLLDAKDAVLGIDLFYIIMGLSKG